MYVAVFLEDRLQGLAYFIDKDDIVYCQCARLFALGCQIVFFNGFVDTNLMLEPIGEFSKPHCQSLMQQTWSIWLKLYRVIMEALNTKSLISTFKHNKTIDFAEWDWLYFSQFFSDPPVKKGDCDPLCELFGWLKRIMQGPNQEICSTINYNW